MLNITNRCIYLNASYMTLNANFQKVSRFKNYNYTFKSCSGQNVNGIDDWTLSINTRDFVSEQHWQISINKFSSCTAQTGAQKLFSNLSAQKTKLPWQLHGYWIMIACCNRLFQIFTVWNWLKFFILSKHSQEIPFTKKHIQQMTIFSRGICLLMCKIWPVIKVWKNYSGQ